MAKMILVVAIIVSFGAALGAAGWVVKNKSVKIQQPEVSSVAEPEATNQIIDEAADLSSKALATEDWKTYRNEEYGFEVKYPFRWSNAEEQINKGVFVDKFITFRNDNSEWINIRKFELKSGQSFKDVLVENTYLGETGPEDNIHPKFSDFEYKKVGNNNFYYIFPYLSEGQYSISYWYVNKLTVLQIELYAAQAEGDWQSDSWQVENQLSVKIFNQILSTFKFIK